MRRLSKHTALVAALMLVAGCQTLQIKNARKVEPSEWPTDGQTAERTRYSDEAPEPPLEPIWDFNAQAAFGPGSPLIYRDIIIVGTRKGEIHAVDFETGDKEGFKGFGEAIEGSPLISDGVLYVTTSWGSRVLQAYNLNRGSMRWRIRGVPFETALIDAGDTVVGVDVEAVVRAHAKNDGAEVWRTELGTRMTAQASPVAIRRGENVHVVVATDKGDLVMLNGADGSVIWSTRMPAPVYESPAIAGESILVPTTRGILVSVDASTGDELWRHDVNNRVTRITSPAVGEGRVVIGTSNAQVIALDAASGAVLWDLGVEESVTAPPLLTPTTVYAGTMGQRLLAIDAADGVLTWEHKLDGRIKSAMAVYSGSLIVLTDNRRIHRLAGVGAPELADGRRGE